LFRIILKHKKLPEGEDENTRLPLKVVSCKKKGVTQVTYCLTFSFKQRDQKSGDDIAGSTRSGILHIFEAGAWQPHFFVLTKDKMYYSQVQRQDEDQVVCSFFCIKRLLFLKSNFFRQENEDEDDRQASRKNSNISMMSNATSVDLNNDQMKLHFAEPWFHRTVHHGRVGAEGNVGSFWSQIYNYLNVFFGSQTCFVKMPTLEMGPFL
jgi:hypothetical protein